MLLCVLLTTILAQAPPEAAATEPAEVCEKAELRAKLGECFRSTIGAIECLSNPPHEDNEEKPSKALIMCLCIAKLEKTLSLTDGMCAVAPIKPLDSTDSAWLEHRSEDLELRDESTGVVHRYDVVGDAAAVPDDANTAQGEETHKQMHNEGGAQRRPPAPPHHEQLEMARRSSGSSSSSIEDNNHHAIATESGNSDGGGENHDADHDGGGQQKDIPCDAGKAVAEMKRCLYAVEAANMCMAAGFTDCVCIIANQRAVANCLQSQHCMAAWWRAADVPTGCSSLSPTSLAPSNDTNNDNNDNNDDSSSSVRLKPRSLNPGGGGAPYVFRGGADADRNATRSAGASVVNGNGAVKGMSVSYEWPSRIMHAQDAARDSATFRDVLTAFVKAKAQQQRQQQHVAGRHHAQQTLAFGGAVRSTVVDLEYEDFNRQQRANVDVDLQAAFKAIEKTVVKVALPRYIARLDTFADSDALGWRLDNIKAHVLPGDGSFAQELVHVSPDTTGISGVYCLTAPPSFDEPGSELMLTDPRRDLPQAYPLPPHTGSLGGGDNNPFFWDFKVGGMVLFPGDVPRMVTMNPLIGDVVYISFDFKRKSDDDCSADDENIYEIVAASSNQAGASSTPTSSSSLPPLPLPLPSRLQIGDMKEVYTIRRKADQHVVLSDVEDATRWGTPIGLMQFQASPTTTTAPLASSTSTTPTDTARKTPLPDDDDGQQQQQQQQEPFEKQEQQHDAQAKFNDALVRDAEKLAERYRRKQNFAVFQSPNSVNLFTLNDGLYSAVEAFKPLVNTAILAYTSATPDCNTLEGGASSAPSCRKQAAQWQKWASEIMMSNRGKAKAAGIYKVTSSWVNIAGKVQRSINQIAHNHIVYQTAVTGVYYATSGWGNASSTTAIQLMRPSSLESKIGPSMLTIRPKAGTMLLFPSYILHAADIHLGDEQRVSFAFNAAA